MLAYSDVCPGDFGFRTLSATHLHTGIDDGQHMIHRSVTHLHTMINVVQHMFQEGV